MTDQYILSENIVNTDPFKQFERWYNERLTSGIKYPDSVSLASSSPDGKVSVRTVLMKDYSQEGFVFFTNYNSKKGNQLTQNPNAAMLFFWPESGRQVRIEGVTEKVSEEESLSYFGTRPRESQISAWASEQSTIIPGRDHLEKRIDLFKEKFYGKPVEKPAHWGGFRLVPDLIEFWQEGEFRLHDRILYARKKNSWHIARLAP
jgi:pyridoxamine 5'-phosphate oxidase